MKHLVVWVDIPATDFKRAVKFYEAVLKVKLKIDFEGVAAFPHSHEGDEIPGYEGGEVAGCIYDCKIVEKYEQQVKLEHSPSATGVLIYLQVTNISEAINAVEGNGGKVLSNEKLAHWGNRVVILDSEGNRVALFAPFSKE